MASTYVCDLSKVGDEKEIALVPRRELFLAKPDLNGQLQLYTASREDRVQDRVARIIHDGLADMWKLGQLFDLQVIIQDQVFLCHRVIMAAVSGYFRSLLASGMDLDEKGQAAVSLDPSHVTPKTFRLLLQLFYKGKDVIQPNTALEILDAASYLQMLVVEYRCVDVLVKDLGERTCLRIWEWADSHNSHALAVRAKNVALNKFQTLRRTEDFLKLSPRHLGTLLGHDYLTFRYEDELLEAILDWVEYAREDRRQYLKEFLPFVCFPYLSIRFLNELRNNELIGLKTEFASYVDEALTYHLAGLQLNGRQIQADVMARQAHVLKRLMPNMRRVVVMLGGCVVQQEPLTNVTAGYLDMKNFYMYAIASLPHNVGVNFSSAVWRNDVYISGGSRAPWTFAVYMVTENAWHVLDRLPRGREKHAMVQVDGRLYLLGGRDVSGPEGHQLVSEISMYDIEARTWADVGRLDVPVEAAPAAALGDQIYVFGGKNEAGESVSIVQCFDTKSREVSVVSVLPDAVDNARAAVVGKDIILVCPEGPIYRIHAGRAGTRNSGAAQLTQEGSVEDSDSLPSLEGLQLVDLLAAARKGDFKKQETRKKKPSSGVQPVTAAPRQVVLKKEDDDETVEEAGLAWTKDTAEQIPDDYDIEKDNEPEVGRYDDKDDKDEDREAYFKSSDRVHNIGGSDDGERNAVAAYDEPDVNDDREDEQEKDELDEEEQQEGNEEEEEEDEEESDGDEPGGQQDETDATETSEACPTTAEAIGGSPPSPRRVHFAETPQDVASGPVPLHIYRLTTMKKRKDFGIFVRKADVYIVGGQAENGNFLDDILLLHAPSGMMYTSEGRLAIPMASLQTEMTAIPFCFLMQLFDTANLFSGE